MCDLCACPLIEPFRPAHRRPREAGGGGELFHQDADALDLEALRVSWEDHRVTRDVPLVPVDGSERAQGSGTGELMRDVEVGRRDRAREMTGTAKDTSTFVIVGAGLAGAKAAESLRGWGFEGRVVLVGEETLPPYERPPLSKDYLRGTVGSDAAAVHDVGFYDTHGIELLTSTRVTSIDVASASVAMEPGGPLHYGRLLLATGARPKKLAVPGSGLDGVFSLRNLGDTDAIRAAAQPGTRAVVIGAGLLGCEVAASLRRSGVEVAMVGRSSVPLQRALGPTVGRVWQTLHADHGVELHLGTEVASLAGSGSVDEVRLSDGTKLGCDLVVTCIGVSPKTELAETAGLEVRDGVVVDEHLETSVPGIFAAGDVADAYHPLFGDHVRAEHWWTALTQGPVAAANMLGNHAVYDWIPYFSSKQFDLMMEYTGFARTWDDVIIRGDLASRSFMAFYLSDGVVRAGLNANVPGAARHIKALVASHRAVDPALLADPGMDLAALARTGAGTKATPSSEPVGMDSEGASVDEDHATSHGELGLSSGMREWYETCPCCLSQALPAAKQALDEERATGATAKYGTPQRERLPRGDDIDSVEGATS